VSGPYTYPDASIVCGRPQFFDRDCLLNPLVVEVLSPSTESRDRGEKFAHYRRMDSLQEYVLIAQDRMRVEHYTRQDRELWLLEELNEPDQRLVLSSVGCEVQISETYRRVTFAPE
jgi:Uma2 family endonuclease